MEYKILLTISFVLILFFGCTIQDSNGQEEQNQTNELNGIAEEDEEQDNGDFEPANQLNGTTNGEEQNGTEGEEQGEEPELNIVNIPESIENNCVGFLVGSTEEMETINAIGGAWARPHPGPFIWGFIEKEKGEEYDFEQTDEYVREAQENNISLLPTLWPFANWDQEDNPECKVSEKDVFLCEDPLGIKDLGNCGIPSYRCKPNDMEAYKEFLSALVERYDGDGINDMPGLKIPIKYWEISNEPDMQSEELTFFIGDEQDYFELLKESYNTIKETCEDCKVLHAGCAGQQEEFLLFWENVFELGGGNYFDIGNIHFIGSGDLSTLNTKAFKDLMNEYNIDKPVWVTEAEFPSQDSDVLSSSQGAFNAGAEKIFFVGFKVGGHAPTDGEYSNVYKEVVETCN